MDDIKIPIMALAWCAALAALPLAGCGDDDDDDPTDGGADAGGDGDADSDADGDTDGDADSDADAGEDGGGEDTDTETGRGLPGDFPEECTASCQEACDAVAACDGDEHEEFPISSEECVDRCVIGTDGPVWKDVTGNFRCCASREGCDLVGKCGGWLAHPETAWPCEVLCSCVFGPSTVAEIWQGAAAPPGYRFAERTLVVEEVDHSVDFRAAYGAEVIAGSRYQFLRFPRKLDDAARRKIELEEKVLPTLVDGAGRLAAAVGGLVVRVEGEAAGTALQSFAADRSLPAPEKLHYGKDLYFIPGEDGWLALELREDLAAIDGLDAELDMLRIYEQREHIPDDPMFDEQWHLKNTGLGGVTVAGVDGRVSEAWDVVNMGDPEVVVAILDNGVDIYHPDLADHLVHPTGDDNDDYNYPDDWKNYLALGFGFHGTPCAGVAAAIADNDEGGAGVCPECSIFPQLLAGAAGISLGMTFQVTDKETADLFVKLVDMGAWVISNSWGPQGEEPNVESPAIPAGSLPSVIATAFEHAENEGRDKKGTVILFAMGNSNQDASADPYVAHPNVIGVAGVDDQGLKSYFSNYGSTVDVAAPTNGGLTGGLHGATAPGVNSATNPGYTEFTGTSAACPFAAGVAGMVLSANKDLTAAEVRDIMTGSATKIDPVWGAWDEDGFSPYYGHGLVNVYRAVMMARATDPCTDPASCPAPSDATCGASCETLGACATCRTSADCGQDEVCQALPALGHQVCVAADDGGGCEAGTVSTNGYCVPTRDHCGLCGGGETCDGRDENCDGVVDEVADCDDESHRCLQNGEGCAADANCAATSCADACESDNDCEAGGTCKAVKNRYGDVLADTKICHTGMAAYCDMACQAMASSLKDKRLQQFIDCVNNNPSCNNVYLCAALLPIDLSGLKGE
jgi:hypothetical protein